MQKSGHRRAMNRFSNFYCALSQRLPRRRLCTRGRRGCLSPGRRASFRKTVERLFMFIRRKAIRAGAFAKCEQHKYIYPYHRPFLSSFIPRTFRQTVNGLGTKATPPPKIRPAKNLRSTERRLRRDATRATVKRKPRLYGTKCLMNVQCSLFWLVHIAKSSLLGMAHESESSNALYIQSRIFSFFSCEFWNTKNTRTRSAAAKKNRPFSLSIE